MTGRKSRLYHRRATVIDSSTSLRASQCPRRRPNDIGKPEQRVGPQWSVPSLLNGLCKQLRRRLPRMSRTPSLGRCRLFETRQTLAASLRLHFCRSLTRLGRPAALEGKASIVATGHLLRRKRISLRFLNKMGCPSLEKARQRLEMSNLAWYLSQADNNLLRC